MNYCKDCMYIGDNSADPERVYCDHPRNLTIRVSPVDGEKIYEHGEEALARSQRFYPAPKHCGPEGLWFRPRSVAKQLSSWIPRWILEFGENPNLK